MQFSRSIFIFRLVHVFELEFASGIKDICVNLHMIYDYMLSENGRS